MSSDLMLGMILVAMGINFVGLIVVGLRMEIHNTRNESYERRLAVLEEAKSTAPSHADLNAIRDRIAGVAGQVTGMSQVMTTQTDLLRSIQNHLLERD